MNTVEKIKIFLIALIGIPLCILFLFYVSPYIPEVFPGSTFLIFLLSVLVLVVLFLSKMF